VLFNSEHETVQISVKILRLVTDTQHLRTEKRCWLYTVHRWAAHGCVLWNASLLWFQGN